MTSVDVIEDAIYEPWSILEFAFGSTADGVSMPCWVSKPGPTRT